MSALPSIEAIMLEVNQSFGGKKYPTVRKNNFVDGRMKLETHTEMSAGILKSIFEALNMDPQAQWDAINNFLEFGNAYKALELNTWTFDAEQQQVLWHLLGYFYVPVLARRVGFWSLGQPLDKGMPGGRFWYLPELYEEEGQRNLYLPVAQVVDWLLDLLGTSLEGFADERSAVSVDANDALRRSLYNWRKDTLVSSKSIEQYFSDNEILEFRGTFELNKSHTAQEQFSSALLFLKRKNLTAEKLAFEIPFTKERLDAVLDGSAEESEQTDFVELLAERYAKPSMQTIRHRLLLARAVQDGYFRLLKYLCASVARLCTDPQENKLLQLFAIYKHVFNLTLAAQQHCYGQEIDVENSWFEQHLSEFNKKNLFLSILPSRCTTSHQDLGVLLTRRFYEMQPGDTLEDHVGLSKEAEVSIVKRNYERDIAFGDEILREVSLIERMQRSSPWRALQGEHSFWVVSQVAQSNALNARAKDIATQRLRKLAGTPAQRVQAIILELDSFLNIENKKRTKDTQAAVQALLSEAEASEGYELWKAVILQYKAKHQLAANDFEGANRLFREALNAASERSYGPLRGELARDGFAVEVANQKLIHNNHERYYREMLANGMMVDCDEIPSFEETARWVSEYFWNDLYRPYPGVPRLRVRSSEASRKMFEEVMPLIMQDDQEKLKSWIKSNRKLLSSSLPDVDGNSVLMLFIKMSTHFNKVLPLMQYVPELQQLNDTSRFQAMLGRWRQFIGLLVKEKPEQLNIADFKKQTPLMLMTEAGDTELVKNMLQEGADPEMQDIRGMTALHSAIKSGKAACVDALLEHPCRLDLITYDGRTPLHTASWTANLHAVKRLVAMSPELVWVRDVREMTPLELVEFFIENPESFEKFTSELGKQGIRCASREGLGHVQQMLSQLAFSEQSEPAVH